MGLVQGGSMISVIEILCFFVILMIAFGREYVS